MWTQTGVRVRKRTICIPWICYERSFSEFYLSIWNQLVFNQRLQSFVQSPQPYLLFFAWRNSMCFPDILVKKTNEYLNSAEQIPRNWNVDQLSMLITSWDITQWCSINLLWKELMVRMSEHTGLISPYPLLIIAACRNAGGLMKGSHPRPADRCPFVLGNSIRQVTSFMQLGMLWVQNGWFFCPMWHSNSIDNIEKQ